MAHLCGRAHAYMKNPTEPQAHYGFYRQPRHNLLICEVIANHYTVGFRSSDINTWPQRTARPTLPQSLAFYLSPTFYVSLEKRVIKSAEIAWARTSGCSQAECVHSCTVGYTEAWWKMERKSALHLTRQKRHSRSSKAHTEGLFPTAPGYSSVSIARAFLHIPILRFYSSYVLKSPVEKYCVPKVIKHFYIFHSLCHNMRKGGMSHGRSDLLQWFVNKARICSLV